MFSKVLVALAFVMGLTLHVQGHAIIAPPLGVSGTPVRNDVQRPSTANPCGNVNIAQNLDTSTPIAVGASGTFSATVTNFNAGKDGSRQVAATVDDAATGKNFIAATVTQNGDLAPTDVGSQQVTVQLPAGTTCTGGTAGNLCLVSFKTAGGFGNCVVVQQGATTAATGTAATGKAATGTAATGATKKGGAKKAGKRELDIRAVGSRAARALKEAFDELL